jgi:fibronectin-binding autotransporter adhesin
MTSKRVALHNSSEAVGQSDPEGDYRNEPAGVEGSVAPGGSVSWAAPVSGDWDKGSNWTGGKVPGPSDDVTIAVNGEYTVMITAAAAAQSLTIDDAGASVYDSSALTLDGTLALDAGTFALVDGATLSGATLSAGAGGTYVWSDGTLSGDTYQGALDLGGHATLTLTGTVLTSRGGSGAGKVNMTGPKSTLNVDGALQASQIQVTGHDDTLNLYGSGVLNHTTLTLGDAKPVHRGGDSINFYSASGGAATLTLGSHANLVQTGIYATINGDQIVNQGTITAGFQGGVLAFDTNFDNHGNVAVSNGSTMAVNGTVGNESNMTSSGGVLQLNGSVDNAGTVAVSNGGTVMLGNSGSQSFTNSGTISISGGTSELQLFTSETTAALGAIQNDGGELELGGALTNTGATLALGSGTQLGELNLSGLIDGGTVTDAGGGLGCDGGTLSDLTYDSASGTIDLGGTYQALTFGDGDSLTGGDQGGVAIDLAGQNDAVTVLALMAGSWMANITGTNDLLYVGSGNGKAISTAELLSHVNNSTGTVVLRGTLDNTGTTLAIGSDTAIGQLQIASSEIAGGTITDANEDPLNGNGNLSDVTLQGTVPLENGDNNRGDVLLSGTTTFTGADGTGPGTLSVVSLPDSLPDSSATTIQVVATLVDAATINDFGGDIEFIGAGGARTLDNATVNLGVSNGYGGYISDSIGTTTLTLGSNLVVNQVGVLDGVSGGHLINEGTINIGMTGGLFEFGSYGDTTVNNGNIVVTNGGTLEVGGLVTSTGAMDISGSGSALYIEAVNGNGDLTTSTLTLPGGTRVYGEGTITAAITNNGLIEAGGGAPHNGTVLTIQGDVTGGGSMQIDVGNTLELGGSAAQQETVNWNGSGGVLQLDQAAEFSGTLNDFAAGDVINIGALVATAADIVGSSLNVTLSNGSSLAFSLTNTPNGETIYISNDGHNLTAEKKHPDGSKVLSYGFAGSDEILRVPRAGLADWSHGLDSLVGAWPHADFGANEIAGYNASRGVTGGEVVAAAAHDVATSAGGHEWATLGLHFF